MQRKVPWIRMTAPLTAAAVVACAPDPGQRSTSLARDSVGVVIVESTSGAWQPSERWRIGEEAVFEIGLVDGPAEYRLFRAFSAVRLSDGRLVLANGGTNELRFYDEAERHMFSVGRTGNGPGEFTDLQHVWRFSGDSLLAYDFTPSRLSVFSASGDFVRSFLVASPDGRQIIVKGVLADGSLIVAGVPIWDRPGATSGIVRDSVPYYLYDKAGELSATIGVFPSTEVFRFVTGDDWRLTSPPFPRAPVTAVSESRFYFGPADAYEILTYTPSGGLERIVRLPHARRAVTPDDIARFRRERLERAEREGTRQSMERMLSEMPSPEFMPPYRRVVVDGPGNLWIADYSARRGEAESWNVFSPAGELLGPVDLPARLEVFEIGSDYVLGHWLDELEVEHVRRYALIKP